VSSRVSRLRCGSSASQVSLTLEWRRAWCRKSEYHQPGTYDTGLEWTHISDIVDALVVARIGRGAILGFIEGEFHIVGNVAKVECVGGRLELGTFNLGIGVRGSRLGVKLGDGIVVPSARRASLLIPPKK
jgi:hypothetical protein